MLATILSNPPRPAVNLAIFDLDNTLIAGDSDYAWGEFLVNKQLVDVVEYRRQNDLFYQAYKDSTLDIHAYQRFVLTPLARFSATELAELHREFMDTCIAPLMLVKAQTLLQQHRDNGDYLLIITATNSFITHPIAKLLGVDDILATDPEIIDGRFTGEITGTPCFQEGKVIRLRSWLTHHGKSLDGSYFYSDSINDLPLLEHVTHPVVVDPDERLRQTAQARHWPIISLRDE